MKLILVTGRANSGKTTLANHIAQHFGIKRISASDYTKSLTSDHSRKSLETVFNNIISQKGYEYLAQKTIDFAFYGEEFAIIDGLRHSDFLQAFKTVLGGKNCFCIGISIDEKNRFLLAKNAKRVEAKDYNSFCEYEKNSTHEIYADEIFAQSDYKIYNELIANSQDSYQKVLNAIQNFFYH